MSNPHSPEPARWILEMFAPDIPAWNRAFNELEKKPLSELEDMLVHSFDRYLRRKGYLTKEQVEVLQGIARKHNVPLPPIPPTSDHTKQEASAPLGKIIIPQLESRENARLLALLTDTEGTIGWTIVHHRTDKIDERYRYEYDYRTPYISVDMDELESSETVTWGAKTLGIGTYSKIDPETRKPVLFFITQYGRAYSAIEYMAPHFVKFRRLAPLILILFQHHTLIPKEKFDGVITQLFGEYLRPKEANLRLLTMTTQEYQELLEEARKLTDEYLR